MKYKNRIIISLSFAIALCYCLPWIALIEQVRVIDFSDQQRPTVGPRVIFLFASVFAAAIVFFYYNVMVRYRWDMIPNRYRAVTSILTNIVLTIIISVLMVALAKTFFGIAGGRAYLAIHFFRNTTIAIIAMLIAHVMQLVEKLREEKIEVLTLRSKNIESELAALRSQIDPHFLFNTLTTLSGLARMRSDDTVPFIDHMAETFRYMLDKREYKKVSVKEELQFLQSYLFMIKKRFDQGISLELDMTDAQMDEHIPQFALQIAVENAIKHNVVSTKQVLHIRIISRKDSISVINNLQKKNPQPGYGIGLENLAQRYYLLAKKNISIKKDAFSFEINLPTL